MARLRAQAPCAGTLLTEPAVADILYLALALAGFAAFVAAVAAAGRL